MARFANQLAQDRFVLLPGVYDGLSAKLAEAVGHKAVYCSGFVAAASHGLPDLGLLDATEMRMHFARITASVQIPVVVDGDAGYGGVLNVQRTIELLARAGVDTVHIEDQVMPKKCGHLAGKSVVPFKEAYARMGAAIEAGNKFGVDIIARTDALSVNGVEDAVARASAFRDLGAAAIFIDGLVDAELIRILPSLVPGPLLFNAVRFEGSMPYSATTLQGFGYACAIYPGDAFCAAASAVSKRLSALLGPHYEPPLDAVGLDAINALTGQRTSIEDETRLSNHAQSSVLGRIKMP